MPTRLIFGKPVLDLFIPFAKKYFRVFEIVYNFQLFITDQLFDDNEYVTFSLLLVSNDAAA